MLHLDRWREALIEIPHRRKHIDDLEDVEIGSFLGDLRDASEDSGDAGVVVRRTWREM